MRLGDFIKILDTIEPINVYLDGCEDGAYEKDEIPKWYNRLELSDIYYDADGISVSIYTNQEGDMDNYTHELKERDLALPLRKTYWAVGYKPLPACPRCGQIIYTERGCFCEMCGQRLDKKNWEFQEGDMSWYSDGEPFDEYDPPYCEKCKRGFTKAECDACQKLHEEKQEEDYVD